MSRLATLALGISPEEVSFTRRGFSYRDEAVRRHLEEAGRAFVAGYTAALEEAGIERLAGRLAELPPALTGFAYEGAAMALALLDFFTPWRRRFQAFLAGPGAPHTYLVHVGAGWALARLPVRPVPALARFDPVLRWLAMDGFGFHHGFFHWRRSVAGRQQVPRRMRGLRGYGRRAFDQGLGRSLWFVRGADAEAIAATVAGFDPSRHGDLWSGVGLACAYAGGVERRTVERLRELAGRHRSWLAQGAAFAAKARHLAGNLVPATESACRVLCGLSAPAAAALSDEAGRDLPPADEHPASAAVPAFELWRRRIEERLRDRPAAAGTAAEAHRDRNREGRLEPCASSFAVTG